MAALSGDTVRDTEQKTVISFATGSYVVHFHAPATFVSIERPHPLPPPEKNASHQAKGSLYLDQRNVLANFSTTAHYVSQKAFV